MTPTLVEWPLLDVVYTSAPVPIGLIVLATDRVSGNDVPAFFPEQAEAFVSRIPMPPVVTPETLAALGANIASTTELLVPAGPLAAIGFACTSGTVAVGVERVHAAIGAVRPGVPVSTPVEAGAATLATLGVARIALLTPYIDAASRMIEAFFADHGIEVVARGSFKLEGDPDMNRVSPAALIEAGTALGSHPDAEALFISCTGMRTRPVIEPLEAALAKPVLTSNQVLAWDLLRRAGLTDPLTDRGQVFRS